MLYRFQKKYNSEWPAEWAQGTPRFADRRCGRERRPGMASSMDETTTCCLDDADQIGALLTLSAAAQDRMTSEAT